MRFTNASREIFSDSDFAILWHGQVTLVIHAFRLGESMSIGTRRVFPGINCRGREPGRLFPYVLRLFLPV